MNIKEILKKLKQLKKKGLFVLFSIDDKKIIGIVTRIEYRYIGGCLKRYAIGITSEGKLFEKPLNYKYKILNPPKNC